MQLRKENAPLLSFVSGLRVHVVVDIKSVEKSGLYLFSKAMHTTLVGLAPLNTPLELVMAFSSDEEYVRWSS